MRPPRNRRHHPLASASSAAEHLILRHFGFRLIRPEPKDTPPPAPTRAAARSE